TRPPHGGLGPRLHDLEQALEPAWRDHGIAVEQHHPFGARGTQPDIGRARVAEIFLVLDQAYPRLALNVASQLLACRLTRLVVDDGHSMRDRRVAVDGLKAAQGLLNCIIDADDDVRGEPRVRQPRPGRWPG